MQEWQGNIQAAERILYFLGADYTCYTCRKQDDITLFGGKVWGKLLVLICGPANEQFGIQLRSLKTRKSQCGALLFFCRGIEFEDDRENSGKMVVIHAQNGNVVVNKCGIYSNIS